MSHEYGGRLRSRDLRSVAEAIDAFGEDGGLLVCRIRRARCCGSLSYMAPFFTIPEGFHALVQSSGKDVNYGGEQGSATWPAGLHWGVPWLRATYLVTKQSVVYDFNVKQCITRDNVPVSIRATAVLRVCGDEARGEDPALVRKFVYEMGVRGLETQLVNAVEEGVRVMARDTLHKAVYALASGGGITHSRRPRPPPASVSQHQGEPTKPASDKQQTVGAAKKLENRSTRKPSQVAPDSHFSPVWTNETETVTRKSTSPREQPPEGGPCASTTATATDSTHFSEPTIVNSTTPSLPAIQRGLRASRILPTEVAAARGGGLLPSRNDQRSGALSASAPAICTGIDRVRVHPEGELSHGFKGPTNSTSDLVGGDGGDGGGGGVLSPPLHSRSPPVVTNLDFSPSAYLSDSSTLPKLELDLPRHAPPMSILSKTSSVHTGSVSASSDDGRNGNGTDSHVGKETIMSESEEMGVGDDDAIFEGGDARMPETVAAPATALGNAAADTGAVSDADGPENAALGRRQAERLRDRLNKTLSPQGVEVSCVMVRSVELPSDIAEQMAGATLNVSLAAEQRKKKQSEAQRVRCEEEVLGLGQSHKIERELASREGDEEVEKARLRLQVLRARAGAATVDIAAKSTANEQRVASEAQRDVSRSKLNEVSEKTSKTCFSDKAAGIIEAEMNEVCVRTESGACLEVARNAARARELVDAAEGEGAVMLRAARAHLVDGKRLEIWESLAENNLALLTSAPLIAAAKTRDRSKQTIDALTALMLSEASFKAQAVEALSSFGRPGLSSLVAGGRTELGAQLALATRGRGAVGGAPSFAVRLRSWSSPSSSSELNSKSDVGRCRDGPTTVCRRRSQASGEARGRRGRRRGGGGGGGGGGGQWRRSAAADCELCILRDGVPYRLLCSV